MKRTDNTMRKNIMRIQGSGLLVVILNVICLEIVDKQDSSSELSVLIALALFLFDIIMACVYWKYFRGYFYKEDYFVMRSYRTDMSVTECADRLKRREMMMFHYILHEIDPACYIMELQTQRIYGRYKWVKRWQIIGWVTYRINLYKTESGTEITCRCINRFGFHVPIPPIYLDEFFEKRCNARYDEKTYSFSEQ